MTADVSDLDALLATAPPEPATSVTVVQSNRKCRRHDWAGRIFEDEYASLDGVVALPDGRKVTLTPGTNSLIVPRPTPGYACLRCGAVKDEVRSRRGRTSRRAGNDAERQIAKLLGGKRTGQFGGPDDVTVGELFVIQSKAGGWFTERVWAELQKLPRTGGRVPLLIVSDRPGSGHRTRRYVVVAIDDWISLHGPDGVEEAA